MFKSNFNKIKLISLLIIFFVESSISYGQYYYNYDYNYNWNYDNYKSYNSNYNWTNDWKFNPSYLNTYQSNYNHNYYNYNSNYSYYTPYTSYSNSNFYSDNSNFYSDFNSQNTQNNQNIQTNQTNQNNQNNINSFINNFNNSNINPYQNYQNYQNNWQWTTYNPTNYKNNFDSSNYYNDYNNFYNNDYNNYNNTYYLPYLNFNNNFNNQIYNQNQQNNINNNQYNSTYDSTINYFDSLGFNSSNYDYNNYNYNSNFNFLNYYNGNFQNLNSFYQNVNNNFNSFYNNNQNTASQNQNFNTQFQTDSNLSGLKFSINKTTFSLTDTWQLSLTGAPANQRVTICAISNLGIQSCSYAKDLGLNDLTDSFGSWSASGNWIKNGVPDESVIGNWTEWIVIGGKLENGQVIGGTRSNNINFTISKQTLSPQNPTLLQNSSLGVYIWGDLPQTINPLKTAVDDALSLGVKTVRITLSPCFWDPKGILSNPQPLYNQILRDDYSYVFRNFSTVMATIYPLSICDFNSGQPYYRLSPDIIPETRWQEILNNVYNEIKQTVITAKINYPNTTIIWSNWEIENDCQDNQWQRCVEYQRTRLKAIKDASLEVQNFGGNGMHYSAIEFILLEKNWVPSWIPEWGPPPPPRQNSGLITAVEDLKGLWDFISYSSWGSIYYTEDPDWRPNKKFASAFNIIRQACYNAGIDCSDKIIIGEVGTLYDQDTNNSLLYEAISTSIKESAKFIYNWNLYDQITKGTLITPDGKQYDQSKFGKFDLNRILTPQGKAFKEWFLGNF